MDGIEQCHVKSDYHKSKMKRFYENPAKYIKESSKEFEESFVAFLKNVHLNEFVSVQDVYDEEFKPNARNVSINSTQWKSFADFLEHFQNNKKLNFTTTPSGELLVQYPKATSKAFAEKQRVKQLNEIENQKRKEMEELSANWDGVEREKEEEKKKEESEPEEDQSPKKFSGFSISAEAVQKNKKENGLKGQLGATSIFKRNSLLNDDDSDSSEGEGPHGFRNDLEGDNGMNPGKRNASKPLNALLEKLKATPQNKKVNKWTA